MVGSTILVIFNIFLFSGLPTFSKFCYFKIDGNPENQIGPHILAKDVQKPINLKFNFQGSQNLHIRVAISHSDVMLPTQFCHRMFS